MKNKKINQKNRGYTLLETTVAVSIFVILITVGMGALLNASNVSKKSKDLRNIMDNFNFSVEDMSRNIRDGYNYRCYDNAHPWDGTEAQSSILDTPRSCEFGQAIIFENANGGTGTPADQWGYKLSHTDSNPTCGDNGAQAKYNLCKTIDGGNTWFQLNPTEIQFDSTSLYAVLGAEPYPIDQQQPLVTIKLLGSVIYRSFNTPLSVQTTVSQRYIEN